jgi:hypothetical protein
MTSHLVQRWSVQMILRFDETISTVEITMRSSIHSLTRKSPEETSVYTVTEKSTRYYFTT